MKKGYICEEVHELSTNCEIIWVKIKVRGRRTLYLCCYYRCKTSDKESYEQFERSVERASRIPNADIVIGGDFNFPGWDWSTLTLKPGSPEVELHYRFRDFLHDQGMEQMVTEPSRGENTLDLFITNNPNLVPRVEVVMGISDHDAVYAEFKTTAERRKQTSRPIPLYNKADWDGMRRAMLDLCQDFEKMDNVDAEDLWSKFKSTLLSATKVFIPHKDSHPQRSQPWFTPELRRLINRRDRSYKKWKKQGTDELREEVKQRRREAQRHLRRAYWNYLDGIFTEDTSDTQGRCKFKRFWSYLKNQKSSNIGIAPLKVNGCLHHEPLAKAEALNEHFQSVFGDGEIYTADEYAEKCAMPERDPGSTLEDIKVNEEGVTLLLKKLDPKKASGPDGISARILKELADEISPLLTKLFKVSLATGKVPSDWKDAYVTPILKKGQQYDPANYRPVSLTSIVSKLMEHVIVS